MPRSCGHNTARSALLSFCIKSSFSKRNKTPPNDHQTAPVQARKSPLRNPEKAASNRWSRERGSAGRGEKARPVGSGYCTDPSFPGHSARVRLEVTKRVAAKKGTSQANDHRTQTRTTRSDLPEEKIFPPGLDDVVDRKAQRVRVDRGPQKRRHLGGERTS